MKHWRLLLLLTCLSSFSCTSSKPGPLQTKMVQAIAACKNQAPCVLRISDLTPFAWDKMYACKYTVGKADLDEVIGTRLEKFNELQDRIIFINGTTIVLHEEEPTDVEKPVEDGILFDIPDTANCQGYDHNVLFTAKQSTLEDGSRFYELSQIR